ncbi:uncharacterized protein EURHEDRAFT_448831 [Aspergillus ruber CBS 135680]|uniref:Uncharacterized protein n=1 Tax=Aspergillus ruber (strain CBS 135680) TaxID=1388766 RepID=A0A017SNA6_ASPRC|nr:uncharacterized protein EURHEDRAFT_448831 [Aspergillus ruber CBS 135680]EYE98064.1 hypothetical protein EURHEDRAFT_448831 [Aspergillus ruber CBS 135680]
MRIKGRKSRVDRRLPQRGGRFTSAQLAWMDRDQERLHRAREKEKKRIANKKRQAEKEAKEREERRKEGIPDQHAMPVPSSQPLLSKFLAKPQSKPASPSVETPELEDDGFEGQSDGGDTEVCSLDSYEAGIEAFDQRIMADEERRMMENPPHDEGTHNGNEDDDEDAFSECSAFYDEDFIREAETTAQGQIEQQKKALQSQEGQSIQTVAKPAPPPRLAIEESFRDDTADFLEQFGCDLGADGEFAPDEDFERELVQLNAG